MKYTGNILGLSQITTQDDYNKLKLLWRGSKCWYHTYEMWDKVLGVTYTTQSIAKQIVAELNEKRFVRV